MIEHSLESWLQLFGIRTDSLRATITVGKATMPSTLRASFLARSCVIRVPRCERHSYSLRRRRCSCVFRHGHLYEDSQERMPCSAWGRRKRLVGEVVLERTECEIMLDTGEPADQRGLAQEQPCAQPEWHLRRLRPPTVLRCSGPEINGLARPQPCLSNVAE